MIRPHHRAALQPNQAIWGSNLFFPRVLRIIWSTKQNSIKRWKTASPLTEHGNPNKKIQTASKAAVSRCKKRERGGGGEMTEGKVKKKKREGGGGWRTWAGEMSAPQGGRPVLSTANRRRKHLQDKQSAHYLWEHWHCRQQDTSLQKHHCCYTWKASFQNSRSREAAQRI